MVEWLIGVLIILGFVAYAIAFNVVVYKITGNYLSDNIIGIIIGPFLITAGVVMIFIAIVFIPLEVYAELIGGIN